MKWTPQDDGDLRRLWRARRTTAEIARALRTTVHAVEYRMRVLRKRGLMGVQGRRAPIQRREPC